MLRSLVILGLASGVAMAADAKAMTIKLHGDAFKDGDLWTVLQCEAYATRQGFRITPALGGTEVYGDPLFAFPADLRMVKDADSRVLVATSQASHAFAPDGRPLGLSLRFGFNAETAAFSPDGAFVGVARGMLPELPPQPGIISVRDTTTGEETMRVSIPALVARPGYHFMMLQSAVAHDGSAFASAVGRTYYHARYVALAHSGSATLLPGLRMVRAVGPKGAWLVADQIAATATEENAAPGAVPVLRLGEHLIPIAGRGTHATGKGHVVTLIPHRIAARAGLVARIQPTVPPAATPATTAAANDAAEADTATPVPILVGPDGKPRLLAFSHGTGASTTFMGIGDHLVVSTGGITEAAAEPDPLGGDAAPPARMPARFAVYSWDAVIAQPTLPPPSIVGPGDAVFCPTLPAAVYYCRGNELLSVDLAQTPATEKSLGTFGQRIVSVLPTNNRLRIHTDAGYVVADLDGQTLWAGRTAPVLNGPLWMTTGEGAGAARTFSVVHLGGKPELRAPVALQVKAGQVSATPDPYGRFIATYDAEETRTLLNPQDGRPLKAAEAVPRIREFWDYHGRFGQYGARLYDKRQPWPDGTRGEWMIQDALVITGSIMVLDDLAQVWTGRRGGPFTCQGTCPGATGIVLAEKEVQLVNAERLVVGRMIPGPKLVTVATPAAVVPESPGPWQLDLETRTFTPPRSVRSRWSGERSGILPIALHSAFTGTATPPLTAVTRSVVLGLDNSNGSLRLCADKATTR